MQIIKEDELGNILTNAPVGICILDAATGRIDLVNSHFLKLTGQAGKDLSGKPFAELLAETAPDSETPIHTAIKEGRPQIVPEIALRLERDGQQETIWTSLIYTPVRNMTGKVSRIAVWLLEKTAQGLNEELA